MRVNSEKAENADSIKRSSLSDLFSSDGQTDAQTDITQQASREQAK